METLDAGHLYRLSTYDGEDEQLLRFMKREGPGYPGNEGAYPGTNCQEVLRALIDRVSYLNWQIPCVENEGILRNLREALWLFELRAAARHGREARFREAVSVLAIEDAKACVTCGHLECEHTKPHARSAEALARAVAEHFGINPEGAFDIITTAYEILDGDFAPLSQVREANGSQTPLEGR